MFRRIGRRRRMVEVLGARPRVEVARGSPHSIGCRPRSAPRAGRWARWSIWPFWNRHRQFPSALPGMFIRARLSRPENVLQRDDGRVGDRREGQADHVPVELASIGVHVAACEGPLGQDLIPRLRGRDVGRGEPAAGRVVVVRAGVDHAMGHEPVRQVLLRPGVGAQTQTEAPAFPAG